MKKTKKKKTNEAHKCFNDSLNSNSILGLILVIGITALPVWLIYLIVSGIGINKDIIPLALFCFGWIFIDMLILLAIICDFKENWSRVSGKLTYILFTIITMLAFIVALCLPFKEVYYCDGNKCVATTYAITTVTDIRTIQIYDNTEYIGMNNLYLNTANTANGHVMQMLDVIGCLYDMQNIEKFKQANGGKIKLYSIWGSGLIGMLLFMGISISFVLIFNFSTFMNSNGSVKLIGKIILSIVLIRFLYVFFVI